MTKNFGEEEEEEEGDNEKILQNTESIWRFIEIWISLNHPFLWDFPLQTMHFGYPALMETPIPERQRMHRGVRRQHVCQCHPILTT